MKKFFTKALAIALVFVCFFAVGCGSDAEISKRAINACKKYIDDLEVLQTEIDYHIEYGYDHEAALAVARQVEDTELSKFGIEYSNYNTFNFSDGTENGHSMFSPQILYGGAVGVLIHLDRYVDYLDKDNFSINTNYKFLYDTGDEFLRVRFSNNTLYAYVKKTGYQALFIIKLKDDSTDWKSVEKRAIGTENNGITTYNYNHYYYIEKSTDDSRVFNSCRNILWRKGSTASGQDQIAAFDFEETTQKMLFVDDSFYPADLTEGVTKTLYDYMQLKDYTSFVDYIDTTDAVAIEIPALAAE